MLFLRSQSQIRGPNPIALYQDMTKPRSSKISLYLWLALLCLTALTLQPATAQDGAVSLAITGAPEELERNIRAHVSLAGLGCDTTSTRFNRALPGIRAELLRASRALGYYHLTSQVNLERVAECWTLSIAVDPGAPVTIGDVAINITSSQELFAGLLDELPIATGDVLNHALYERLKSDLSGVAIELGFFSARFASAQLLLDLQANTADIDITFEPGERFQFGDIRIAPIAELSDEFIRRYISFNANSYYSAEALLELRNSLNNSLYFSEVSVTPALSEAVDQRVPILVGLRPRPRRVYSVGGGVTTDIGPRLRMDYEDRYLNPSGHKLDVNLGASPLQQNADATYVMPLENPATESLQFSTGLLREDNDTYENVTTRLGVSYGFVNGFDWQQNIFTNYQHDEYTLNDQREVADLLIGGVNVSRTSADDALYPTRGWRLFGQLSGASSSLLSTTTFLQLNVSGKLIHSIGPGRFLFKFEVGTSLVDDLVELPVSLKYFSGGDQSVRGYQYQSLGPKNDNGDVEGGKHVMSAGVEYDFNIANNWKLALFTDVGNAFNDWVDYKLNRSVGAGIRWLSPIGPIRFDVASALDDDNRLRLHITMGPDL